MTTRPNIIITVDTEGDNIWARPEKVTTENARYLPRFQSLCEEYGFKPTYLVTYEMAVNHYFQSFGRSILRRKAAEIGTHIHAWNSPPLAETPYDTRWNHAYLYEFTDEIIHGKVEYLTELLSDVFDARPVSHRAGKWGFNERVARVLAETGYQVDCSVTPGVSWSRYKGAPDGRGGPDYFGFPGQPYFLDLDNIGREGSSPLLEVPVTIKPNYNSAVHKLYHAIEDRLIGKALTRVVGPTHAWLRPRRNNIKEMFLAAEWALESGVPVMEFVVHSSELMPGGSPTFPKAEQIETLYEDLRKLFGHLASLSVAGMTLAECHSTWTRQAVEPVSTRV